jgi:hypothetical protein
MLLRARGNLELYMLLHVRGIICYRARYFTLYMLIVSNIAIQHVSGILALHMLLHVGGILALYMLLHVRGILALFFATCARHFVDYPPILLHVRGILAFQMLPHAHGIAVRQVLLRVRTSIKAEFTCFTLCIVLYMSPDFSQESHYVTNRFG